MGYYADHLIYLEDKDKSKLGYLRELMLEDLSLKLTEATVYDNDGEPFLTPCLSDEMCEMTYSYVEDCLRAASRQFNQRYPDDKILVYRNTEDGFEILEEYFEGESVNYKDVIHFRKEIEAVCDDLNSRYKDNTFSPTQKVIMAAGHPTVLHHDGAYTLVKFNVYELFRHRRGQYTPIVDHYCSVCYNYSNVPNRIKAMNMLYEHVLAARENNYHDLHEKKD